MDKEYCIIDLPGILFTTKVSSRQSLRVLEELYSMVVNGNIMGKLKKERQMGKESLLIENNFLNFKGNGNNRSHISEN